MSGQYRYKVIYTEHRSILIRDDGKRIDRMVIWPDDHEAREWEAWAIYGDNGLDAAVADELFRKNRL